MSDHETQATGNVCPQCGAERFGTRAECWLCGAVETPEPSAKHGTEPPAVSFSLSTLLLVMTLACICLGLLAIAPGLGVFVCVVLLPVFVRTSMVVKKREEQGLATPRAEKVSLFVGSFLATSTIVAVVSLAAFLSFCFSCLGGYNLGGESWAMGYLFGFAGGGAVTVGLLVLMSKWIAARYRRDTQG